jgi:hypothetical protein
MALGAGLAASAGIVTEATNGTAAVPTHFLEFNSESMKMEKHPVQGVGLRAPVAGSGGGPLAGSSLYMRTSRRVVGSWGAKGGIVFDAPFSQLGLWLEHMVGAFTPGTVGGTNNPLVVQQGASAAWLQTYTGGSLAGKTFTLQIGKPDSAGTVRPFTYVGTKVESWELATEINKYATITLGLDAWQELTPDNPQGTTVGPALTAPSYAAGQQFFHFREATIYNGGTLATAAGVTTLSAPVAAARVTKANIKVTNPVDTARYFIAGTGGTGGSGVAGVKGEQLENNYRIISGALDVEFYSLAAYYDVFAGDTTATLELIFTGPTAIASTYFPTLSILIPNIKYDGDTPVVAGPGILNHALPFSGFDDETDNQVQIQYMSTDLVP